MFTTAHNLEEGRRKGSTRARKGEDGTQTLRTSLYCVLATCHCAACASTDSRSWVCFRRRASARNIAGSCELPGDAGGELASKNSPASCIPWNEKVSPATTRKKQKDQDKSGPLEGHETWNHHPVAPVRTGVEGTSSGGRCSQFHSKIAEVGHPHGQERIVFRDVTKILDTVPGQSEREQYDTPLPFLSACQIADSQKRMSASGLW